MQGCKREKLPRIQHKVTPLLAMAAWGRHSLRKEDQQNQAEFPWVYCYLPADQADRLDD